MYCERLIYKSQIQLLDKERILEAATFDRTKIRYVFFFFILLCYAYAISVDFVCFKEEDNFNLHTE